MVEDSNDMELLQPPDESSPNNILNALDDDCLRETFGKLRDYLDFYSVANVCVRFSKIAKEVFASKFKKNVIRLHEIVSDSIDIPFLAQTESFLCIFGQSVSSFDCAEDGTHGISGCNLGTIPIILRMLTEHCSNLRHLRTVFPEIDHATLLQIQPFLSKLQRLDVTFDDLTHEKDNQIQSILFSEFISTCSQLNVLRIHDIMPPETILPAITFPKMITFECSDTDNPSMLEFLESNPQLQKLRLLYSADVCRLIRKTLPNLQKIHLLGSNDSNIFGPELARLNDFDNLIVKLYCIEIASPINHVTPMENVTFISFNANIPFDENYLVILARKFKNLKVLSVNLMSRSLSISTAAIKQMLKYTDKLTLLKISGPRDVISHFDAKDYNELLETVQKRTNHTKLHIEITNYLIKSVNLEHVDVKLMDFDMHPEWLTVSKTNTIYY